MGFFDSFRQRRAALTGPESVATLDHMQDYFQDGANWARDVYQRADGARCLVGAANHVRVSSIDDAKHWLRQAIAEIAPETRRIEDFNDTRGSYVEIAAVIVRAKQLALAAQRSAPLVEILPPERQAPVTLDLMPRAHVRSRPSLNDWLD